ncbi:MAG: hypothetical protein ABII64_08345 [Elusimicrobiota bacterium]
MGNIHDKSHRASASQFFVAAELCRRGLVANVTLGNCPNVDILCTDKSAKYFVHIQVKTFLPGSRTCPVGIKAEKDYGDSFIWVIAGIPDPTQSDDFSYYIIPSKDMSENIREQHKIWVAKPGMKGQAHDASTKCRGLVLPPGKNHNGWRINKYLNRWDLIMDRLQNI